MTTWQLQDAKNRFSAVVDAALTGEPQEVTRRGKPVVVVVAFEEYQRLCQTEKAAAPNFIEHLLAIPKGGPDDLFERIPLKPRDLEL
ncbi:MAG: type II toxin-antitoxin system Phd/YefM family antitoxin [Chloroflexi bacterium]|nr:type II toxin-antitoxin system Phd/YefM family antitoxin [Chloroflexota bacterium]MYD49821.1 type II toxin-antitoxin system Phd/YefM family antitoxin [Chloroflexota bacterium]